MTSTRRLQEADFAAVEAMVNGYVEAGKTAGMLTLVSRDGELLHRYRAGFADIASRAPIREDTIFRIYSMTKPLTSVALLQFVERGLLDLDDPARRWIPALGKLEVYNEGALETDITVRQLLTHTAGFSYGFEPEKHPVDALYAEVWQAGIQQRSLEELMDALLQFPLLAQPGTLWHYSIATDICGYLVELLADMPFGDYLQAQFLDPLEMVDTAFEVSADRVARFSTLYGPTEGDSLAVLETSERSPFVPSLSGVPVRLHSGGGGLVSTAPDYWRFAQMMLNRGELDGRRIVAPATVDLMTRNQVDASLLPLSFNGIAAGEYRGYGFGLGYCITMDPQQTAAAGSRGDFGWGGMADTYCWVDPAENLVAILMQQYLPSLVQAGRKDFRDAVYASIRK
ncbi:MAG TPA: serine hydrolase domain-containing protein [Gammaproteobacteria bacterium]|nr:serine hydrolase domain-containing protein [Gammaproteobacteria bacterium]